MEKYKSLGYKPGNLSDRIKNFNLKLFIDLITEPNDFFDYIELHSGQGIYPLDGNIYHGTSKQAYDIITNIAKDSCFYLHEKNDFSYSKLKENFNSYPNMKFYSDWKENIIFIENLLKKINTNNLVVSDPSSIDDHNDVILHLDSLLCSKNMFLYVPQGIGSNYNKKKNEKLFEDTISIIESKHKPYLKLTHSSEKKGAFQRLDHNIMISSYENIDYLIHKILLD